MQDPGKLLEKFSTCATFEEALRICRDYNVIALPVVLLGICEGETDDLRGEIIGLEELEDDEEMLRYLVPARRSDADDLTYTHSLRFDREEREFDPIIATWMDMDDGDWLLVWRGALDEDFSGFPEGYQETTLVYVYIEEDEGDDDPPNPPGGGERLPVLIATSLACETGLQLFISLE